MEKLVYGSGKAQKTLESFSPTFLATLVVFSGDKLSSF